MKKIIGVSFLSLVILLGLVSLVRPQAVSTLSGLAVAQTATKWNQLKDMIVGDAIPNGSALFTPCLWNGVTCDRQRGSISGGAEVAVRSVSGGVTPASNFANPTNALTVWNLGGLFDGATWDQWLGVSNTNNIATTSQGVAYSTQLSTWTVRDLDAGATQTTATRAAGGGTVRHVATGVLLCRGDTAAAVPAQAHLRDGATGAGTILMSWVIGVDTVNESKCEAITGLNITGSANTAMTIEFAAAGSATSTSTVTLAGYSTP